MPFAGLFLIVLSNLGRNLVIGHLVGGFNADDSPTQTFACEPLFELSLRLTGTQYQDGFSVANIRDHLVVVSSEMVRKLSVSLVICRSFC